MAFVVVARLVPPSPVEEPVFALEDLPEVDEVYVAIGGGGLISGIALAIKELHPQAKIYGVEPENSNVMSESVRHQKLVVLPKVETIADGLAAKATGRLNLSIVRRCVDQIILVSDQDILRSTLFLLEEGKVLVEPSGATSFAGMLANPKREGRAVAYSAEEMSPLSNFRNFKFSLEAVKSSAENNRGFPPVS